MDQEHLSLERATVFTFTEICEGGEIFEAHSHGNGHFIPGTPSQDLEVCFELKKSDGTLHIQIQDLDLFQWLDTIPSLRDGFDFNATTCSIRMDLLLPYYSEVKEKFNQDRFQGLTFNALDLFVLHFLRDRSIFAMFGLEDLYQARTLTLVHFHDLDRWNGSMSKDLDHLDEIVDELDGCGELDECGEPDDLDEPGEQDQQEQHTHTQKVHSRDIAELSVTVIHEPLRSELHAFVRKGDLEAVERLLGMTPATVDAEALCIAIRCHNQDILRRLLEHGAQVDGDGRLFPLCDAAKGGNKDAVQLLLSRGANIEAGLVGWTPLTYAASEGHFETVQCLVDKQGVNVDGGGRGFPLSYAIENGHTRVVDYLLASGADVFKCRRPQVYCGPPEQHSPYIAFFGPVWLNNTDYTISFERLVADCCARTRYLLLSRAAADGDARLVEYLASFGVDFNSTEEESPLYRATMNRHSDIVCFLLRRVTDVQAADVTDLLWCAVKNGDLDTIDLLLGCGPRLDPTLLSKLLSVAGKPCGFYRVKEDAKAYDGFSICLPKDESFPRCNHWSIFHSLFWDLYSERRAEKCEFIIDKLVAKIVSALEDPYTVCGYVTSTIFKSIVQRLLSREVTNEDFSAAAAWAQERRNVFRRLFARIGSSRTTLLHAGASQGASAGLVTFADEAGSETSRAIWRRGTRAIRNIGKGCLPSSLSEIVSILQVANAMRSAVPPSDVVCSENDFANDIPKWAALLNQEDQCLFLEVAEHLWGLPPRVEIDPTRDTFSILEDLKQLVNNLMRASGLFDHDSESSSNCYRLHSLRQRHLSGMSRSHTYDGDPLQAERCALPVPDLQETPQANIPEPPDPEGGHSSILRDIAYLMTGAIFGVILLFLCLPRYGYSTLCLPILASYDGEGSNLHEMMDRNRVILALYIGAMFCVDLGSWKRIDHLPVPTSLSPDKPNSVPWGRAEENLAAFESRSEGAYTTINPLDTVDTAMQDAPPGSPKLQPQVPTFSSAISVPPSATTTASPPDLTREAVSEDRVMYCKVGSCTSKFRPGKNQIGNFKRHQREQHIKKRMYECKWKGCDWKKPRKGNVQLHERTCKKRGNGIKANSGRSRRRL